MALGDDLQAAVTKIFKETWSVREGRVVPEPEDLQLGNEAVHFELATILYADLHGSTAMVQGKTWQFSSEIYKTFLSCATRIIKSEGGAITSYDGDRVMGVFVGDTQCSPAGRSALKINYAVKKIIMPSMKAQYNTDFSIRHTVGIDASEIRVARTGVRGDNDLVFVGRAANFAAKLTEIDDGYPSYATETAYNRFIENMKKGGNPVRDMWERRTWTSMNNLPVYRSNWTWML